MDEAQGKVDLHLHSNASDGVYTPSKLIEFAARCGLKAVALTDHDTVDGIDPARKAGVLYGIEVVPGVEISAYEQDLEVHILGFFPNDQRRLADTLAELRCERRRRMEAILSRLEHLGLSISYDAVADEAAPAAPGRLHLARLMVKTKIVGSLTQAFSLYLQRGRPGYVSRKVLTPARAVAVLSESGAIPVLAHPGVDGKEMLQKLLPLGLRGVEVYHPDHTAKLERYYYHKAMEMGLLITGGSDFHGDPRYRARLPGAVSIPYHHLQRLKEACG